MSERAVSTIISYVLTLGIVVLLLISLLGVFAPLVTGQQEDAVRSNLDVYGNDLAGDLESADRLLDGASGENGTVELRTRLPERVGGSPYEIELEPVGDSYRIALYSPEYETTVRVSVQTDAPIETQPSTLAGGTLLITEENDSLVVENA